MKHVSVCVVALAVLLCVASQNAWAQDSPVYSSVFCMKVLPGKGAEMERHLTDVSHKLAQVAVNERKLAAWMVSRAVAPVGDGVTCDYVISYIYSGPPPAPLSRQDSEARVKKAGLKMTFDQIQSQRASLYKIAEHKGMVRYGGFGTIEKGDYYQANYMKARPGKEAEFHAFEQKVWVPAAQAAAKDGHPRKAWMGWHVMYPSGTATHFDDITLDVFRDWESIWKPQGFPQKVWDDVAPGKTVNQIFDQVASLRDLTSNQLYVVTDLILAADGKVAGR